MVKVRVFDARIGVLMLISWAVGRVGMYGSYTLLVVGISAGVALSMLACLIWVHRKNRDWKWALFGMLYPIGWLAILPLKVAKPIPIKRDNVFSLEGNS